MLTSFIEYFLFEKFLIILICHKNEGLVMTSSWTMCTSRMTSCIVTCIMMITMWGCVWSAYFMKLDPIVRVIFFFSIESYVWEIVPNWEKCCINQVWEKELVEHNNHSKWNNQVLMSHNISKEDWWLDSLSIEKCIFQERKQRPYLKNICLLYHINNNGRESEEKKNGSKNMLKCVEGWMCGFCYNESSMKWEENCKNKNKIYSNTDNNYWKTKRKKSSLTSKCLIPEKQYG